MAESLDDFSTLDVFFDTANDIVPPIRLNAGDINGRRIRIIVTDKGKPLDGTGMIARLLWNIAPSSPTSGGGIETMTLESYQFDETHTTAAWSVAVPRHLLLKGARTSVAGLEITKANGDVICSSNIDVIVEKAVINAAAPEILDPLKELHDALKNSQEADATATQAKETAEQAVQIANQAKETAEELVNEATASATAAATSETNAKTSETNAANSATAAAASADAAKASQTAAAESASQAAASAVQAGEDSDNAATSASNAASSATTATQSATSATESKNAADASATAAAASADAAKVSQNAAAAAAAEATSAAENFDVEPGTISKLPPGSNPTFTPRREGNKWVIDAGLVTGDRGENTAAISGVTFRVGTAENTTPTAGVDAGGTPTDRTLAFWVDGIKAHTPRFTAGTTTTGEPGTNVIVDPVTDENGDVALNLTVPRGSDGTDANVTSGNATTVTDGRVDVNIGGSLRIDPQSGDQPARINVRPKDNGGITSTTDGVGVSVDGKTIKVNAQGQLEGAQSAKDLTVNWDPDDFTQDAEGLWNATKAVQGLGALNQIAPVSTWDNVQAYAQANPVFSDHLDNQSVPDGSVRATCSAAPGEAFSTRIIILKEA